MKRTRAATSLLVVLLAGQIAVSASTPLSKSEALYTDLLPHFQVFFAELSELSILTRKPMSRTYSVILVQAYPSTIKQDFSNPDAFKQEAFGLFVLDNTSGRLHMPIDIFATKRWSDYVVIFERIDERRVDIRRRGANYGDVADRVSYFLDIGRKKVLGAVTHHGMNVDAMAVFQGALYFVGTGDLQTAVLVKLDPPRPGSSPTDLPGLEVIDRIGGRPIQVIRTVSSAEGRLVLRGEDTQYVLAQDGWTIATNPEVACFKYNYGSGCPVVPFISFWVPSYQVREQIIFVPSAGKLPRRFLVWNRRISANSPSDPYKPSGLYEITGDTHEFYPLPQPTYDLFQQNRPKRVEAGYTKDITKLETDIGPFQLEGGRIWFGLSFYDGETYAGVGGIGYFDVETRNYHLTYLKELADWSASAIYVEPGAIWLGLAHYGEGASVAGGLVKYDRRSKRVTGYSMPALVNVIRSLGNRLFLGTSEGISIVVDDKVEHLRFEVDLDGKYHILR